RRGAVHEPLWSLAARAAESPRPARARPPARRRCRSSPEPLPSRFRQPFPLPAKPPLEQGLLARTRLLLLAQPLLLLLAQPLKRPARAHPRPPSASGCATAAARLAAALAQGYSPGARVPFLRECALQAGVPR